MTDYEDLVELRVEYNKLVAALGDALRAFDVAADKVCGCGFVGQADTDEYREAEKLIENAGKALNASIQALARH